MVVVLDADTDEEVAERVRDHLEREPESSGVVGREEPKLTPRQHAIERDVEDVRVGVHEVELQRGRRVPFSDRPSIDDSADAIVEDRTTESPIKQVKQAPRVVRADGSWARLRLGSDSPDPGEKAGRTPPAREECPLIRQAVDPTCFGSVEPELKQACVADLHRLPRPGEMSRAESVATSARRMSMFSDALHTASTSLGSL